MLLVIDVGNTNTVLGLYEGETLMDHWRVATDRNRTSDEYAVMMRQLFELRGRNIGDGRCTCRFCASCNDCIKGGLLVLGISLNGFNQVRD